MYTVIIVTLIFIVISLYLIYKEPINFSLRDIISNLLKDAMLGFVVGLFIALIIPCKTKIEVETNFIVSLQDNSVTEGSFFLGSGAINREMKYTFYQKEGEHYILKQVPCENAKVKFTEGEPKVERSYKTADKNHWLYKFSIILPIYLDEYIFYVPKGTIKQNYTLDAK